MSRALRRSWLPVLALALLAAACGSAETATEAAVEVEQEAEEVQEAAEEEVPTVIPDTVPAIEVGAVSSGSVEIDGVTIEYVTSVPEGFEIGSEIPLLLAFPPGGQDYNVTRSLVQNTYSREAQRLGWAVVSPVAPGGELFFNGSEALVPGFLDWVETWVTPEGGAPHVAGVSNGGISTFRYGALNPDRAQSLIAFPGFPRSTEDQAALADLTGVPVRIFVGGEDTNWIPPAEEAVETLTGLGGDAELTVFAGEGHVMDSTRDGTLIFEQLESFR